MNVDLLKRLAEAGTPMELIAEVAAELAKGQVANDTLEQRRSNERKRKREERSREVTGQHVTERDIADTAPVLDKETSPRPPKEINPTPGEVTALARKAAGFGPPDGVSLANWNALCQQRKKSLSQIAYDRICKTLREGADAGWPPGELVERSIERGYETVFVPTERRNERRSGLLSQAAKGSGASILARLTAEDAAAGIG